MASPDQGCPLVWKSDFDFDTLMQLRSAQTHDDDLDLALTDPRGGPASDEEADEPSAALPIASGKGKGAYEARRRLDKKRKRRGKSAANEEEQARMRLHFLNRCRPFGKKGFDVRETPHSAAGYIGLQDRGTDYKFLTGSAGERLSCLRRLGYAEIDPPAGAEVPLIDRRGLVYGVIVGEPSAWGNRTEGMLKACQDLVGRIGMDSIPSAERRGGFGALAFSFSYRGGQTAPCNIPHNLRTSRAIREFQEHPDVEAFFRYIEGPFQTWFPEVQARYTKCRDRLQSQLPNLRGPAPQSSFAASTLNVGPRTVCNPHRDSGNVASGICVDHAFGLFDSAEGGHLVLHEPRLVIRLHPGATVLFPSAVITHENIPIRDHEQRMSLTMYSAGGLFRFLEQGSQTKSKWQNQDPESAALHGLLGESRWEAGWNTFMTIEELYEHWTPKDEKSVP